LPDWQEIRATVRIEAMELPVLRRQSGSEGRSRMRRILSALLLVLLSSVSPPVWAQGLGEAVEVRQSARIVSGGATRTLTKGSGVASGDSIKTNGSGQVQMVFPDETKIVVGANSDLKIDETLFRKDGTARKFAVTALGGSFRFLSGSSEERVFKLATPLATLGIRGTAFDYTVSADRGTDLLVFEGVVRFCSQDRRCATVPGGCQAVTILLDGSFIQPTTTEEKRELLRRSFPLLGDQSGLRPPFRTSTVGCQAVKLIRLPGNPDDEDRNPGSRRNGGAGNDRGNPADGPSDPPGTDGNPAD